MPTYETGDIWSVVEETDLLCITTNSLIKSNGELCMGKGIARQAADRYPGLAVAWGNRVSSILNFRHKHQKQYPDWYGIVHSGMFPKLLGIQTKTIPFRDSPLALVEYTITTLDDLLSRRPFRRVDMPFPGVGNGGLNVEQVEPLLEKLPDYVRVWRYG